MAESKLRELSTDFAVKVIKMCDGIKGHYSLVNQLERSSTSIGANIHEANYAHSKADFVAKFQIALKFCAYREKHGLISIIVRTLQPSGLAIFQFIHFHHPYRYNTNR